MKNNLCQIYVKIKTSRIKGILLPYNNGQLDNVCVSI